MGKNSGHEKAPVLAGAEALGNEINFGEEIVMGDNSTAVSSVIPFDFRGHSVRAVTINGDPWFVAADVCRVLDVTNTTQAMQALDEDERSMFNIGRQGQANVINESGLYTLILRCRDAVKKGSKPHAFRKWVTSEVLPAIRKHGRYEDRQAKMPTLMDELIGMSELSVIKGLIRDKSKSVPANMRQSFAMTMHGRLHTRFNVPRTELIPAGQFEAACNFIAAYALEGEWLGKEETVAGVVNWPASRWMEESSPEVRRRMTQLQGAGNMMITPDMLYGPEECVSPTLKAIAELEKQGHNLEACRLEVMAMKHHLGEAQYLFEGVRLWADRTQGRGIRFKVQGAAA